MKILGEQIDEFSHEGYQRGPDFLYGYFYCHNPASRTDGERVPGVSSGSGWTKRGAVLPKTP